MRGEQKNHSLEAYSLFSYKKNTKYKQKKMMYSCLWRYTIDKKIYAVSAVFRWEYRSFFSNEAFKKQFSVRSNSTRNIFCLGKINFHKSYDLKKIQHSVHVPFDASTKIKMGENFRANISFTQLCLNRNEPFRDGEVNRNLFFNHIWFMGWNFKSCKCVRCNRISYMKDNNIAIKFIYIQLMKHLDNDSSSKCIISLKSVFFYFCENENIQSIKSIRFKYFSQLRFEIYFNLRLWRFRWYRTMYEYKCEAQAKNNNTTFEWN